jgi:2,3-bisphosphoglycerate-dependent phosphoglycerate mutase
MNIFLVRHGESLANIDFNVYKTIADHEIRLSEKGVKQSEDISLKLYDYLIKNKSNSPEDKIKSNILNMLVGVVNVSPELSKTLDNYTNGCKVWNSPYFRARETAKIISNKLGLNGVMFEDPLLGEQQYGLFNGLTVEEQSEKYLNEYNAFKLQSGINGEFFARYPLGESAFDVYCRLRVFIERLNRDENVISNHIIVCHGVVLNLFVMIFLNRAFESFGNEDIPGNCFVRLIESSFEYSESPQYTDYGYIIRP